MQNQIIQIQLLSILFIINAHNCQIWQIYEPLCVSFFLYSVFLSRMQMAARQDFCALNPLEFMRHVEMHLTLPLVDRIQVFESQNKPGQELPENRALESICHQGSWPGRLMAAGLICFWLFRYSLLFMHSH